MHLKLLLCDRGFVKKAMPQLPMASDLCRAMARGEEQIKIIEVLLLQYTTMIIQEKGIKCILPTTKPHAIGFRNTMGKLNCEEKHLFTEVHSCRKRESSQVYLLDKIHSSPWFPSPAHMAMRHPRCLSFFFCSCGWCTKLFSKV